MFFEKMLWPMFEPHVAQNHEPKSSEIMNLDNIWAMCGSNIGYNIFWKNI